MGVTVTPIFLNIILANNPYYRSKETNPRKVDTTGVSRLRFSPRSHIPSLMRRRSRRDRPTLGIKYSSGSLKPYVGYSLQHHETFINYESVQHENGGLTKHYNPICIIDHVDAKMRKENRFLLFYQEKSLTHLHSEFSKLPITSQIDDFFASSPIFVNDNQNLTVYNKECICFGYFFYLLLSINCRLCVAEYYSKVISLSFVLNP